MEAIGNLDQGSATRFGPGNEKPSAFDHADFNRFHVHAVLLQPFDGGFHFTTRAVKFEADDSDFVRYAGLPDVGDDLEFVPDFPDERFLDKLGWIHQPQSSLSGRCGLGGYCRFSGSFGHSVKIYD